MSLQQQQAAIAMLIRLPESNRGDRLSSFLGEFRLTEHEKNQVTHLASDPLVAKYGRAMQDVRWGSALKRLTYSQYYFDGEQIKTHWESRFEPRHTKTNSTDYTLAFFDFLLSDAQVGTILKKAPQFLTDLIHFERARTLFLKQKLSKKTPVDSKGPLLHGGFLTLNLRYDIPTFVAQFPKEGSSGVKKPLAEKKETSVLMTLVGWTPEPKIFEIDAETSRYLSSAKEGHNTLTAPASYADLVELGLCKAMN